MGKEQLINIIKILGWKSKKKNQYYGSINNPLSLIYIYEDHYKYYEDLRTQFTYFKMGEENKLVKMIINE